MAFKVLIPQDITELGKNYLREHGCEVIIGSAADPATIAREVVDCDAILARTAQYPMEVLAAAPKLKVIGRHGIGVDNIDVKYCTENGITVTYAPLSNANSVAEHTIFLMLCCARNAMAIDKAFRAGNFEIRNKLKGIDLEGKTLGLIGLGRIGKLVAKKAFYGFGMKVIGFDPYVQQADAPEGIEICKSKEEVFQQADFVSIHMPATPETKKSVGITQFKLMKKSAYFINAARGEVVNEADLIEALEQGLIRGAGLDVFEQEPPANDSKLLAMLNVIPTPHNAALTQESMDRMGLHAAMGIVDIMNGKTPEWAVNKPLNPRK
jgi:D-3-phosphoglycerate dehydrogenase